MRMLALFALLWGCGGNKTTLDGTVGDTTLNLASEWWGGPFLVLSDRSDACTDMAWVSRYYNESEPPTTDDTVALQFTFNGDDVVSGLFDVAGEAAVTVRFLTVSSGTFTIDEARSGQLDITDLQDSGTLTGTYSIDFDGGTVSGDLDVDWCTNLKA